jgi:hypothetical protein
MPCLRCGSPAAPYSVQGLLDPGRHTPERCILRIACAYLSQAGLETMTTQLVPGRNRFQEYRSEWIIGIDHGLSEPRALTTILGWPQATLRLFCPAGRLNARALRAHPRLHAKVVALVDAKGRVLSVAPSSANITGSAMGPNAQNYEIGVSYGGPAGPDSRAFNRWWREILKAGIAATAEIVERYADFRQRYLVTVPDRLDDLDPPARVDIRNARHLWIESGAMSGPPEHRHQIEFAEDLANYFHAQRRSFQISLRHAKGGEFSRPLTFRGTARGQFVEIWRLGLLTPRMGGPNYVGRVVRFTRLGRNQYALEIADRNSAPARRWVREANRRGYVGRTGGASGRRFGFY